MPDGPRLGTQTPSDRVSSGQQGEAENDRNDAVGRFVGFSRRGERSPPLGHDGRELSRVGLCRLFAVEGVEVGASMAG